MAQTVNAPWWEREEDRAVDDGELGWGALLLLLGLFPLALLLWPFEAIGDWLRRPR